MSRRDLSLIDQDEALQRLGQLPKRENYGSEEAYKKVLYRRREWLAEQLTPVRLKGVEAKKYRTADLEQAIAA